MRQQGQRRREPLKHRVIVTKETRAQDKRLKAEQSISRVACGRVYLHLTDGARCEEGEEMCGMCGKDDRVAAHTPVLQRVSVAEQGREAQVQHDQILDSGIDFPSSILAIDIPYSLSQRIFIESRPGLVESRDVHVASSETVLVISSSPSWTLTNKGSARRCLEAVATDDTLSKSSMASSVSFDQGIWTDQFESWQRQHEAGESHTRAQIRAESQDVYKASITNIVKLLERLSPELCQSVASYRPEFLLWSYGAAVLWPGTLVMPFPELPFTTEGAKTKL
ncbi:uncharacterized protein BP5553_03049 [Venustampulla echinocandica]|uniref:Uncharacterized protein n=1 Tax=Venustampulla echinocandica TaxID=2656787 RepID=A0A370TT48_9HELO|nr:uncharacterized protein BP5553_03049 [Venustampulla echinocandica]RDL38709.1 hypothetical protein BP5553_03049 [Venustampulla echinocandica]